MYLYDPHIVFLAFVATPFNPSLGPFCLLVFITLLFFVLHPSLGLGRQVRRTCVLCPTNTPAYQHNPPPHYALYDLNVMRYIPIYASLTPPPTWVVVALVCFRVLAGCICSIEVLSLSPLITLALSTGGLLPNLQASKLGRKRHPQFVEIIQTNQLLHCSVNHPTLV